MRSVRISVLLLLILVGCRASDNSLPTPTEAGLHPAAIVDPAAEADSSSMGQRDSLFALAERIRREQKPEQLPRKKTVLCLSGGGAYGAYPAGLLVGWTESGNRPTFDVVTGVSTGALVGTLAFLGPEYDCELQRVYTTLTTRDIFRIRKSVRTIFSESLADSSPLEQQVRSIATETLIRRVAEEHAKGRRLYVGTTELDGRRQVVWDLGSIASQGTPESREIFVRILLASASIPGFFPPVSIPISVNGMVFEERHVDGGVTAAIFFRTPWIPPQDRNQPVARSLYDSDLYVMISGKLYDDPQPVKPRALLIASTSVSTLIFAQTRDELFKLYTASIFTGMNYRVAAIPPEYPLTTSSTDFNPVEMSRLFEEGRRQAGGATTWRTTPPGLEPGEQVSVRGGTILTLDPSVPPPVRSHSPQSRDAIPSSRKPVTK